MANEFDGRRVATMVALMLALTAILPPAAAYTLAQSRISRAQRLATEAAGTLGSRKQELRAAAGMQAVVSGPGQLPRASETGIPWLEAPVAAGRGFEQHWPQDPWGRCYLLNVRRVIEGHGGLLVSAGPNGELETPLDAAAPAGDDIGAIVR